MAISALASGSGTWAIVTADGAVTIPGSPDTDCRMFVLAAWKAFGTTAQITSPVAWNEVTEFADGSVAAGANVGSVKVGAWYRDFQGGDTAPTVDYSVAPVPAAHVIVIFQKASSDTWDTPTFVTAAMTTWTTTAQTTNASSTVDVPDGAVVIALAGIRDNSTIARPTDAIADSGAAVTWNGNYVEFPGTHASSTTSNDIAADAGYRLVTTGAAGVTLQQKCTALLAAETGALLWIVQGVTASATKGPLLLPAHYHRRFR